MQKKRIHPISDRFPEIFRELLASSLVFDSSCSREARVYYIEREGGLFLKSAPQGALAQEAAMTRYFSQKGLGPHVRTYLSDSRDWLLTQRIPGEDCTHSSYLSDPRRLCDTLAFLLRQLHEQAHADCPIRDRNASYLDTARSQYQKGFFDPELFPVRWRFASREEAWQEVSENGNRLAPEVLLHGDYCLPNILLDNWRFSGFIDLDCAGVGDRHIDIFWGSWTLFFNLKTDAYFDRFLDAYGRDAIQTEKLRTVAALETFR